MKIFKKEGDTYLLVKYLKKGPTRYWPTIDVRYVFYSDAKDIRMDYIYLSPNKRLYRFKPAKGVPYSILIGWFSGTNSVEELTGLKKQIAVARFEGEK